MKSIDRPPKHAPGPAIRALRLEKNLTLAQVSERTGLSVSTLSKLEKGQIALSYDKLMLLSEGLDVDLAHLLKAGQEAPLDRSRGAGRRVVQRAGDGDLIDTMSYRQRYLATELLHKKMTPLLVDVQASSLDDFVAEFGGLIRHPGEEFALVIEGELDFHSDLYAPSRLKEGDSIYFDSDMGHAYIKASEGRCRIIATCCAPPGKDAMVDISMLAHSEHQPVKTAPIAGGKRVAIKRRDR